MGEAGSYRIMIYVKQCTIVISIIFQQISMTLMQWRIYSKILMKKPGYQKNKLIFFVKWKKYCYETNILIKFEKNADFIQENLL